MLSESIDIKIGVFQLLKNALHGLSVQSLDDLPDDVTTETIVQLTMTFQWPNQDPVKKRRFYQQFNQKKKVSKEDADQENDWRRTIQMRHTRAACLGVSWSPQSR